MRLPTSSLVKVYSDVPVDTNRKSLLEEATRSKQGKSGMGIEIYVE